MKYIPVEETSETPELNGQTGDDLNVNDRNENTTKEIAHHQDINNTISVEVSNVFDKVNALFNSIQK